MLNALKKHGIPCLLILGSLIYIASIFLLNFHACQWYNFDMYSDMHVAKLMAESGSLFPPNWVFGNQYYVIATPVLAALLMPLVPNSFTAMALASCLMTLLILGAYLWCCKPVFGRVDLLTGFFCLAGAVILGASASDNTWGFQLLYTMASYYACYVLGLFFCLGVYLRLYRDEKVSPLLWVLALAVNLALGMQSARQMLVFNIPLFLMAFLPLLWGRLQLRSASFALANLLANAAGIVLIRFLPVHSAPIIRTALVLSPSAMVQNLIYSLHSLAEMSGLGFLEMSGIHRLLGFIAVFFCLAVIAALICILVRRDNSLAAQMILFCLLSLLGILIAGVFLIRTEPRYYFIWLVLVSLSFAYLVKQLSGSSLRTLLLLALLGVGLCNWLSNFYPSYVRYVRCRGFYDQVSEELVSQGIERLYVDFITPPTIAACSGDRIVAATFKYDFDARDEGLLAVTPHLCPTDLLEDIDPQHALVVLSDIYWNHYSSLDYLQDLAPPDYYLQLMDRLELVSVLANDEMSYYLYRFSDPALFT